MLLVSRFRASGGRGRDRSPAPVARHFVGRRAKADRAGIVMRRSGMVLLVEAPARHGDGLVAIDRLSRRLARAGAPTRRSMSQDVVVTERAVSTFDVQQI